MWVDLGLVRNESEQPTKDGPSLDEPAIKRPLSRASSTQQAASGYILLALLVNTVSKREHI